MSLRRGLLNLWLRLAVKQPLKRMTDPLVMRRRLERDARLFVVPEGADFAEGAVPAAAARADGSGPCGDRLVPVTWASRGQPDRQKVILYLHGGAFIAGSPRTHRHLGAALAGEAGACAVLPDYRLAPEHPFPAALEDALGVYRHLLGSGYADGDIALAGDSAGGGLAFGLLLALRREALPPPACAVGFSPWVDLTASQPSHRRNARRDVMLPAGRAAEVTDLYLRGHDPADPLASPLFGAWTDPPPALIMASRSEILVDEAVGLAAALRRGGGDVRLDLRRGLPHAWPIFTGLLPEADEAVACAGAFIAQHLGRAARPH